MRRMGSKQNYSISRFAFSSGIFCGDNDSGSAVGEKSVWHAICCRGTTGKDIKVAMTALWSSLRGICCAFLVQFTVWAKLQNAALPQFSIVSSVATILSLCISLFYVVFNAFANVYPNAPSFMKCAIKFFLSLSPTTQLCCLLCFINTLYQ